MLPIRLLDYRAVGQAIGSRTTAGFHVEVCPLFIDDSTYVRNLDHVCPLVKSKILSTSTFGK